MMSSAHSLCGRPTLFKTHLLHQFFECAIDCSYLPDCLYGPSNFFRIFLCSSVRNDEVAEHTGLRPVMESRRREAIFGHVARMSHNIPAHQALRLQVVTSLGRRPDRDWVRSSDGRPRNRWIDQLRQDHQRPPADLWRAAIQRGHTGATLRSSTTTR